MDYLKIVDCWNKQSDVYNQWSELDEEEKAEFAYQQGCLEKERLENLLFKRGAMETAPCFVCGYNGAGYYNPDVHKCAARHHKLYSPPCLYVEF